MMRIKKYFWDICFGVIFISLLWLGIICDSLFTNSTIYDIISIIMFICVIIMWYFYIKYNGKNNHKKRLCLIMLWCIISIDICIFCMSTVVTEPIIDSLLIYILIYVALGLFGGIQFIIKDDAIVYFIIIGIYCCMFIYSMYLFMISNKKDLIEMKSKKY